MSVFVSKERKYTYLSFILILAVYILVGNVYYDFSFFENLGADSQLYFSFGENIAAGNGPIQNVRPYQFIVLPLYPLLIAFFKILGIAKIGLFLFQYTIFGLLGVLMYKFARFFQLSKNLSLFSVFLYSICYPALKFGPRQLLHECLFSFLFLGMAYFSVKAISKYFKNHHEKGFKFSFLALSFWGLSVFLRPHLLFLSVGFLPLTLFLFTRSKKYFPLILFWPLIYSLFKINISVNEKYHQHKVMLTNYSGRDLYIANNPFVYSKSPMFYWSSRTPEFVGEKNDFYITTYKLCETDMNQCNQIFAQKVKSFITQDFISFFWQTTKKVFRLFWAKKKAWDSLATKVFPIGFILLFLAYRKERKTDLSFGLLFIGVVILYYSYVVSSGLVTADLRYRLPIMPVYSFLSAYGIKVIGHKIRNLLRSSGGPV